MATVILVGGRDAALAAAQAARHSVLLLSDRKPLRRRREQLRGCVRVDFNAVATRRHAARWAKQLVALAEGEEIRAVVAATERAVLPAALLRDTLGLPGNDPECALRCRNKIVMKRRIREVGLPCTDFVHVTSKTSAPVLIQRLGLPLVLKPTDSSGSRGARIARTQRDVEMHAKPGLIAEGYIHGLEMSVESFVSRGRVIFTNITEYLLPLWANVVPATLGATDEAAIHRLNESVIEALQIRQGMTHLELFLTPTGPIFSEIAVRPPGGYLMELIQLAYGFDPWQTVLDLELGAEVTLPQQHRQFSGMWLLHPGGGMVKRVAGLRAVQSQRGVVEAHCRVSPGERLRPREGSGESAGHILVRGATRAAVVATLERARRTLTVELDLAAPR